MIQRARLIGMLKPTPSLPPPLERIAILIPTTSPFMLTSGPPEFPGLIAASVWRKSWFSTPARSRSTSWRPRPLMIPWLTEWFRPNGLPRARTHDPTGASSLLPSRAAGRLSRSSLSTAISALLSAKIRVGWKDRPSLRKMSIWPTAAPATTWLFVITNSPRSPSPRTITPDPVSSNSRTFGIALAGPDFVGDQVDDRRRDRLGNQLERPVDVLELGILAGELPVDRVLGLALDRRQDGSNGGLGPHPRTRGGQAGATVRSGPTWAETGPTTPGRDSSRAGPRRPGSRAGGASRWRSAP